MLAAEEFTVKLKGTECSSDTQSLTELTLKYVQHEQQTAMYIVQLQQLGLVPFL
jgi:hypothetical protein